MSRTSLPSAGKSCFLQMAFNSTIVYSRNLPLSLAVNTASSTSYLNTYCDINLEEVEDATLGSGSATNSEKELFTPRATWRSSLHWS